jgi:hypothetical protein
VSIVYSLVVRVGVETELRASREEEETRQTENYPSEGQVFGGNHSKIGTNDQKRPIWPRNDRNNFPMIVEISQAVMVLETS